MNKKLLSTFFLSTALFSMSAISAEEILQVPESIGKIAEFGDTAVNKAEDTTKAIETTSEATALPDLASIPALPGSEDAATDGKAPLSVLPPAEIPAPQAAPSVVEKKDAPPVTATSSPEEKKPTETVDTPDANVSPAKSETTKEQPPASIQAPAAATLDTKVPSVPQGMIPPAPANDPNLLPSPSSMALPNPQGAPVIPEETPPVPSAETAQPNTNTSVNAVVADSVKNGAVSLEAKKITQRKKYKKFTKAKQRYKNILPETIYASKYEGLNKHLPVARYEQEMDAQVFMAIRKDDINGLRAMLDYGKRGINKPNAQGDTPLIAATKYNAINCVRLLLGRKADANAKDARGLTALENAQQQGSYKIARALTIMKQEQKMANAEILSESGYNSPLMLVSK